MSRFRAAEKLAGAVRDELPRASIAWLAAVRAPLEKLTMAAVNGQVSDAEFLKLVEDFSASLPEMMNKLDHNALAKLMEESMGAAMGNGIAQRQKTKEKRAKLPRERDALLGKPCGDSYIPDWKQCRKGGRKTDAMIARYRAGVRVMARTGRAVAFGKVLADDMEKWRDKDLSRAHYASRAERAVADPDSVFQEGTFVTYHKQIDAKKTLVVHARQILESQEEITSFIPMPHRRAAKKKRGQKTWPRL